MLFRSIDSVDLSFDLDPAKTRVLNRMRVRRNPDLPAQALRLTDRGRIAEGLLANVVIFDPDRFTDRATWLEPQRYAEGVQHLLVRGQLTVQAGAQTEVRAGRVV